MKRVWKKLISAWLCVCMVCSFFTNIGVLRASKVYGMESELVNVARNEGVKVYTNPSVKNASVIVDGDTKYQYVTQGARGYIDLVFKPNQVDENGYNYMDGAYVIVDLGAAYSIDSLKIYDFEREQTGKTRDYIYDVLFSNDADFDIDFEYNVNWTKIGEKPAGTGKYVTDIVPSRSMMARYIKLDNLKCKGATGFVMVELEAWASQAVQIDSVKKDAIDELKAYKKDVSLNQEETSARETLVNEYIQKISNPDIDTKEAVLELLNEALTKMDEVVRFAEYRTEKKEEISVYKNEEGLFTEEDKETQMNELKTALQKIEQALDAAAVDKIVDDYKKMIDGLEVLNTYEVIPSPHSISYESKYTPYNEQIHVVCTEEALDAETVDYVKEIFGNQNVTFSTQAEQSKMNLYLTSDDLDDSVESWMREKYGDKIDDGILAKNESHVIIADENGISIIGNDAEGLFRGLTTIKFIKSQMESESRGYRHFVIKDYADMPFRGLIEGYYGKPWSWHEKAELLKFGSDFKMNKLVFAPKNDPYHTTSWKELYPDQSEDAENNIQNIAVAASTARKYKADLVWTTHCFGYTNLANAGANGIRYQEGDENVPGSDINLLKAKFQQLYDVGVRTFGLLLDDCDYGENTSDTI